MESRLWLWSFVVVLAMVCVDVEVEGVCVPAKGCSTAYAYYRVQTTEDLDVIGRKFGTTNTKIHEVNPGIGAEINFVLTDQPLFIPFSCKCINDILQQNFIYTVPSSPGVIDYNLNRLPF